MKKLLHILTRPNDALAAEIMIRHKGNGEHDVVVIDLTGEPRDYKELLESIFAAESVQTW